MNSLRLRDLLLLALPLLAACALAEYYGMRPGPHAQVALLYSAPALWALVCTRRHPALSRAAAMIAVLPFTVYLDKYRFLSPWGDTILRCGFALNAAASVYAASAWFRKPLPGFLASLAALAAYHAASSTLDPLLCLCLALPANAAFLMAAWRRAARFKGGEPC